jgi:hypothetical protein
MKNKKVYLLGLLTLIIFYFIIFVRPPLPKGWSKVKVGMKRADILSAFPNIKTDLRELKGFDRLTIENAMPYYRNGYWQMLISYYQNDDVAYNVRYRYVDYSCGIFNKTITTK